MSLPIVIVGAGAAGLGAALHLQAKRAPFVMLEARARIGGRALTTLVEGTPLDLGCEWLHHAEDNSWAHRFADAGLAIDRRPAAWTRPSLAATFSLDQQASHRRAFEGLETRIEAAAKAADDQAVGALMVPGDPWNPLLDAFSAAYNGAPFGEISVKDYSAYEDGEEDWRVPNGYGAAITHIARALPVRLSTPVSRIEHGGPRLRVCGDFGVIDAEAVIVAVPTSVIASGGLAFDPPLPEKQAAVADLPLGHVAKVFLHLDGALAAGEEAMLHTHPLGPEPATIFLRNGGRPVAELYVGGDLAYRLETAGPEAAAAFAVERLVDAFGADVRPHVRPLLASRWSLDPWSLGAYSHARVGAHAARARLAAPVDGRLFFAGEATHPTMFSTAHGAHDTGLAAAKAALRGQAHRNAC